MQSNCHLSIVSTLYRSEAYLPQFLAQCAESLQQLGIASYEIVMVDDGSPDRSVAWLREHRANHPNLRIVELSRNFGHHQAALAGLTCARGERVFLIDCDLEVSPGILLRFYETLERTRADVVYGYQEQRKGHLVERLGGNAFWQVFNWLSDTEVPPNILTERLMTRCYVDALLTLGDRNVFLGGMMYWTGFLQIGVPVAKRQRLGASTYSFGKRFSLLIRAITSFSTKPLHASLWVGGVTVVAALLYASFIVGRKLLFPETTLLGFPSLIALLTALFGVVMLALGLIGVYVGRIFVQTQGRPNYIIKNVE